MTGILAYGAYVPHHRLRREAIAQTLGSRAGGGTRAVAAYDEDSTTLGVEAARQAGRADVTAARLLFATATPAYLDKTNATAIHSALGLPSSAIALDAGGALRSGVGALLTALQGGPPTLVVTSDVRTGRPGSDEEAGGGDAAAALLVGDGEAVLAEFVGSASATAELMDRWRLPGETTSRVWEERFGASVYAPLVEEAVTAAMKECGLTLDEVDHVVVAGTHARAVRQAKALAGDKLVDDLAAVVGNPGTAQAGLILASLLDQADPGRTIALVSLADGVDVIVLRTTNAIAQHTPVVPVAGQIAAGRDDLDYASFLTWRGFLDRQGPRRPDPTRIAAPPSFRNRQWKFGFVGSRDESSGAIHLPPQRVSFQGQAVDEMEPIALAEVKGTVATFTTDHLAWSPSPPTIVGVIDFDGGGRYMAEIADTDQVAIGDRVEMTFRRIYTAEGVHNYFWKARPVRAGASDQSERS
ncbi:MAG TPA: OB-fold domain-containing protein [Nitriliruptorales bacterium]